MPQVNTPQTITPDPSYEEATQDVAEPTLSADPLSVEAFNKLLQKSAVQTQDQLKASPQWTPLNPQMSKDDIVPGTPSMKSNDAAGTVGLLPTFPNAGKMFTQTAIQNPETHVDQPTLKDGTATFTQLTENNEVIRQSSASVTTGQTPAENRPTASHLDDTTSNNPLPVGLLSSANNGDTILNNLQSFSQTSSNTALDHSHRLQQIKTELVDQILISSNALENKQVVKIALSPQLLAGTEVSLQKQGNNLQVTFVTTNTQSEMFLVNTQPNLQAHLVERLNHFQDISVSVNGTKGNAASAQGQPQDGRSRNRYEYQTPEDSE
ncbi:MAG: hypothetical protein LBB19_01780 [Puniceicoccales bacterium]|jgi:type III secretion system needle length determinant|nr:hypothetical protein [Puniceicoccales bacterium]